MRTRANRARRAPPKIPKPPKPPKAPKPPTLPQSVTHADVEDVERKAIRETPGHEYEAPDDVLGPLLLERILAQHPELDKDDYPAFWANNWQLEPNEDDRAAVDHITKLIKEMEQGS